jgi:hypothetical protein
LKETLELKSQEHVVFAKSLHIPICEKS